MAGARAFSIFRFPTTGVVTADVVTAPETNSVRRHAPSSPHSTSDVLRFPLTERRRGSVSYDDSLTMATFVDRWRRIARVFLTPHSDESGQFRFWHEYYSDKIGKSSAFGLMLSKLLPDIAGKRVLDLTAGTGLASLALLEALSKQHLSVEGLVVNDPSPRFMRVARLKLTGAAKRLSLPPNLLEFSNSYLTSDSRRSQFDVVILAGSLHFSSAEERIAIASTALRLLRNGGMFIVVDVDSWNLADERIPTKIALAISAERTYLDFNRYSWEIRDGLVRRPVRSTTNCFELTPIPLDDVSTASLRSLCFNVL